MCKFPNWDHSEGIYRHEPNISEQLDAAEEEWELRPDGTYVEVNQELDFGPVSEDDD